MYRKLHREVITVIMSIPRSHFNGVIYDADRNKTWRLSPGGSPNTGLTLTSSQTADAFINIPDTAGAPADYLLTRGNATVYGDFTFLNNVNVPGHLVGNLDATNTMPIISYMPTAPRAGYGVLAERYQVPTDDGTGTVVNDVNPTMSGTSQATSTSSITLDAATPSGVYDGWWIKIGGQSRKILSYDGLTKIAILTTPWTSVPPAISAYGMYESTYLGLIYREAGNGFILAGVSNPTGGNTSFDPRDLAVSRITATADTDQIIIQAGGAKVLGRQIIRIRTVPSMATSRIYTIPDVLVDTSFAMVAGMQTLTDKTIVGSTNTVEASQLRTSGVAVSLGSAPPSPGQILTAPNATSAAWVDPPVQSFTIDILGTLESSDAALSQPLNIRLVKMTTGAPPSSIITATLINDMSGQLGGTPSQLFTVAGYVPTAYRASPLALAYGSIYALVNGIPTLCPYAIGTNGAFTLMNATADGNFPAGATVVIQRITFLWADMGRAGLV